MPCFDHVEITLVGIYLTALKVCRKASVKEESWTQKITKYDAIFSRVDRKKTILQKVIRRKMNLFGHVARMGDDRKLKTVMFEVMDRGKEQKRKTTQRMGGRLRRLGRGYTVEVVPFGAG